MESIAGFKMCFSFFEEDQDAQRHTCRVLTAFFLASMSPFVLFAFVAARDGAEDPTHLVNRIPLVVLTFFWVIIAIWSRRASAATRRARCPAWTERCGEWPEFCQLGAPIMLVLCVCFFVSAVAGDASVPVGSHGLLPVSMLPLFMVTAIGCCAGCCACYSGVRNGWARSPDSARRLACMIWIPAALFTWFMFLLGIKINNLDPDQHPGQAGRVQTGFPYFSTFFPTFLIDVLVFPCAVGFFNRKYHQARHCNNALEGEKNTAKCTVAGLFSVMWLSSIFVRFLLIFDEANLNESWIVVNGGYYDGDVGITLRDGQPVPVSRTSTTNNASQEMTFDQVDAWDILTETTDAQYMACVLTGKFYENEKLDGPRLALGIDNGGSSFIFDLRELPVPTRKKAANASTSLSDGASVVGFCSSSCIGFSHFFLYPLDGPPSLKYACSCWGDVSTEFDSPYLLDRIRDRYDPDEAFIYPNSRYKAHAVPAFDCLEGMSLSWSRDASIPQWPKGRLQRLAGSRFRVLSVAYSYVTAAAFRNTLSQAFEPDMHYNPFCVEFDRVTSIPEWGNFENIDGVGACQDSCSSAKPNDVTVYWVALSGRNCRCGVKLIDRSSLNGRNLSPLCKTFVHSDLFYYHGTENRYSAIFYNRLDQAWTDRGSAQSSDENNAQSRSRNASDTGSPLMSRTAISEIEDSNPGAGPQRGTLQIGPSDPDQTLLAGYDEWDLQALSSGPVEKLWIEVEDAVCTSRRRIGGCSGQAYKYLEGRIPRSDPPLTVCATDSENCFCDNGWVYYLLESKLHGWTPHEINSVVIRTAPNSKVACTAETFDVHVNSDDTHVCVCLNRLQRVMDSKSWISEIYHPCQNVRP